MKTNCLHCGVALTANNVYRGHVGICKGCNGLQTTERRRKNRAAGLCHCGREIARGKKSCPIHIAAMHKTYNRRINDPSFLGKHAANLRRYLETLKAEIYTVYGNKCACCGESRIEFLSIDHVNGTKLKAADYGRKGLGLYRVIKREGFPPTFRILCMNCNFALGHYGYCPHLPPQKGEQACY